MAKSTKPMSRKELAKAIRHAYFAAESLCNRYRGTATLNRALEVAKRQERQHRAFGRRLVGNIGSRATVECCAWLFVVRGFAAPTRAQSFTDREDYLHAYGAMREVTRLPEGKAAWQAYRKDHKLAIQADYMRLIGEG